MSNLKEKMKKEGGFTLIEMLIVVAIIAILIAISIPLVNGALERARDATDQANERSAKAEAMLYYMGTVSKTDLEALGGGSSTPYVPGTAFGDTGNTPATAFYDAQTGKLVKDKPTTGYGKCTGKTDCYQSSGSHADQVIQVVVNGDGEVTLKWVAKGTS